MNNRIQVINAEIQKAIGEIITYELSNPKITGIVSVLNVDTTTDLEFSKVYVSVFTTENKMEVFHQIQHSAGYIRKLLSQKVDLRRVPFLTFYLDEGMEQHAQIDKLINETKK